MNWLLEEYKNHYNLNGSYTIIFENILGLYLLKDKKSCDTCPSEHRICVNNDEAVVFKIDARSEIAKIDIEKFFVQFDGKTAGIRKKCDLMFYNNSNVILCDMTCSENQYIEPFINSRGANEGKRSKAYGQIESVINALMKIDAIKNRLEDCTHKIGLFAMRVKDNSLANDDVCNNMEIFTEEFENHQTNVTDMGNGFLFKTISYPEIYSID